MENAILIEKIISEANLADKNNINYLKLLCFIKLIIGYRLPL